ncbi:MAG: phosphate signaling complex protein PhoU [Candidatus Magnetomorum sp.]|nr:phosphate signaling complex protein PhoU [Candidatus Magnetomorum sp.]
MNKRFHKELDGIKKMILSLGALVEDRVRLATNAIVSCDSELASTVIKSDFEVDEAEVEIEEECLKILALYQPVAVDLRFIIAVIKINNDLERIGDQAVNIAERVMTMAKERQACTYFFDYSVMVENVKVMLKQSLDALVNMDVDLAIDVCRKDDDVDRIKHEAYRSIKQIMKEHPEQLSYLINLFLISRHLERLADHTTNIAEEVIYMIEGEIVRHGTKVLEKLNVKSKDTGR